MAPRVMADGEATADDVRCKEVRRRHAEGLEHELSNRRLDGLTGHNFDDPSRQVDSHRHEGSVYQTN